MTASRNYSNTAQQTTLAADCTAAATTISVSATTGFPAAPFVLAVDYGSTPQELVLVTSVAGTTLTVTRGFDNTTAQSHVTGAVVAHTHAAVDFADSRTHEGSSTGVHGLTGTVVGDSDAQTLTHKDLTSNTNVFPTTLALDSDVTALDTRLTTDEGNLSTHEADTSAHGVTGAVVGTTDVQTLTNKALSTGTTVGGGTDISGQWTAYTPSWTATVTNPTIGNGSITGRYMLIGKTVLFSVYISIGSTTTKGSGAYSISLPFTPKLSRFTISGFAFDNVVSPVNLTPVYLVDPSGALQSPNRSQLGDFSAMNSSDFTFASASWIALSGAYEVE